MGWRTSLAELVHMESIQTYYTLLSFAVRYDQSRVSVNQSYLIPLAYQIKSVKCERYLPSTSRLKIKDEVRQQ